MPTGLFTIAVILFWLFFVFVIVGAVMLLIKVIKHQSKKHPIRIILLGVACFIAFIVLCVAYAIITPNSTSDDTEISISEDEISERQEEISEEQPEIVEQETETPETDSGTTEPTVTEEQAETEEPEEIDVSALNEDEYKAACEELWYDDIFFSEDDLTGKLVKLDVYSEECKYFTMDAAYDVNLTEMISTYNIQRNFFMCGVSRGEENSYVGGQIYVFFSSDYGYDALDYDQGQYWIIYGEIIDYATTTWDGYNECAVIPRYIETK